MVQKIAQSNSRRKGKGGPATVQGRQHQVHSRLTHGVRSRSPVLLQIESEAEWQQHLEGFRQTYLPVGEVEECLVHLIAYQFWRWIGRLIPYERDLALARMTAPQEEESFLGEPFSSADIRKVLSTPTAELAAQENAARAQLVATKRSVTGKVTTRCLTLPRSKSLLNGSGNGSPMATRTMRTQMTRRMRMLILLRGHRSLV